MKTLIGRRVFHVLTDAPGRPGADGPDQLRGSIARVLETGRADALRRTRYDIPRADGGFEERWWLASSAPLFDASGRISAVILQVIDETQLHLSQMAERQNQERQKVLVAELEHRTRNLITVIRSLSDRTVGNAALLDEFEGWLSDRLAALSRVQGLLSHLSAGERVDFGELLRSELTALGVTDGLADRVKLDGPADVPCARRPSRLLRSRCTSWRPTPSNTARSLPPRRAAALPCIAR